jgi:bisphosphoglycerate-independent phosphoglycerate mutase
VGGRYYGMDRDNRWERTKKSYDAIVGAPSPQTRSAVEFIQKSYEAGVTDEFVIPGTVVGPSGQPIGPVRDGDVVIFFNFRSDRARQMTRALMFENFDGFERNPYPKSLAMTTMTQYDRTFTFPVLFPPQSLTQSFAEVMAEHALVNLRLAETEKYPHVSYFFNCGIEKPYPGEDRILVPSPKVATYDLQPEMSAKGITDNLVNDVEGRKHDVIICNFANADMVGHTGKLDAADQGRGNHRPVPDAHRQSRARCWRHPHRDRGSRQCRGDVEHEAERTAHGTHLQSGAGDRRPGPERHAPARRRIAPGHRADDARNSGRERAEGNDRTDLRIL